MGWVVGDRLEYLNIGWAIWLMTQGKIRQLYVLLVTWNHQKLEFLDELHIRKFVFDDMKNCETLVRSKRKSNYVESFEPAEYFDAKWLFPDDRNLQNNTQNDVLTQEPAIVNDQLYPDWRRAILARPSTFSKKNSENFLIIKILKRKIKISAAQFLSYHAHS